MKQSPIQVKPITFRRVGVEFDASRLGDDGSVPADVVLDFDSVIIRTRIGIAPQDKPDASGTHFFLTLHVIVDNQPEKPNKNTRYSPYLVNVEAGAEVLALPGAEKLDDVEDLVVVNGTSLLWSAIREQVSTLTARMPAGMAQLPTVHFHDMKKAQRNRMAPKKAAGKAAKKVAPPRKRSASTKAAKRSAD